MRDSDGDEATGAPCDLLPCPPLDRRYPHAGPGGALRDTEGHM